MVASEAEARAVEREFAIFGGPVTATELAQVRVFLDGQLAQRRAPKH